MTKKFLKLMKKFGAENRNCQKNFLVMYFG